jgi:uncharacterized protein
MSISGDGDKNIVVKHLVMAYQERTYREKTTATDLVGFEVVIKETDLFILAEKELKQETTSAILKYRNQLEEYIKQYPEFQTSLVPYPISDLAPALIKDMANAAQRANVGPMAAVAGAIADYVGKDLTASSQELIIENGGDIFIRSSKPRRMLVYAGDSPFSYKLALEIAPDLTPCGVCTSSGTVGHSLSFGKADAVTIVGATATIADAAATAVGNLVKQPQDINMAIDYGQQIDGVLGILVTIKDKLGVWGKIKLV